MKYSIAQQLALIYTSAGSQRKVASFTGLSHQQVGRILHKAANGESIEHYTSDPDIVEAIQTAFDIHTDVARQIAREQAIPFRGGVPVYAERAPLKKQGVRLNGRIIFTGTPVQAARYARGHAVNIRDEDGEIVHTFKAPASAVGHMQRVKLLGDRVLAEHMHWLDDQSRAEWLAKMQKSKKVFKGSASSIVNLPDYMKSAKKRIETYLSKGGLQTEEAMFAEEQLKNLLKEYRQEGDQLKLARVYTPSTYMDHRFPSKAVANDYRKKLEQRHSPAVGAEGTVYADQYILQLRTQDAPKTLKRKSTRTNRVKPHRN